MHCTLQWTGKNLMFTEIDFIDMFAIKWQLKEQKSFLTLSFFVDSSQNFSKFYCLFLTRIASSDENEALKYEKKNCCIDYI